VAFRDRSHSAVRIDHDSSHSGIGWLQKWSCSEHLSRTTGYSHFCAIKNDVSTWAAIGHSHTGRAATQPITLLCGTCTLKCWKSENEIWLSWATDGHTAQKILGKMYFVESLILYSMTVVLTS